MVDMDFGLEGWGRAGRTKAPALKPEGDGAIELDQPSGGKTDKNETPDCDVENQGVHYIGNR